MTESFFESNPLVAALLLIKTSPIRDLKILRAHKDRWDLFNACLPKHLRLHINDVCLFCNRYQTYKSLMITGLNEEAENIHFGTNIWVVECCGLCYDCYEKAQGEEIVFMPIFCNKRYKIEQ